MAHFIYLFFFFFVNAKKSLNIRFIGRHILFGAFMAKDSWHGVMWQNFPPIRPECFIKTIPADGLELTHSTSGARLP